MKAQDERPDLSEMPPYRLGRYWNTIQAYLIPGIEDDIGELSEELKKFMGICELLIDDKMFAKYRWCGNGRPPSSRVSLFKVYILKAMLNYPYTKTLIAAVRESPTIRRLCGWESVADLFPSKLGGCRQTPPCPCRRTLYASLSRGDRNQDGSASQVVPSFPPRQQGETSLATGRT